MKKVETLRELQLINIYIYKQLFDVCENLGIKLYLLGGTLIGAVRHGGFIPWDDDIDVCMSRPDYNKLLKATSGKIGNDCYLIDPETNSGYNGVVPVCAYRNSKMLSKQFRTNEELKIAISIFVYDGAPNTKLKKFYYYSKLYFLRAQHALCRADFKNVNTKTAKIIGPIAKPFFNESKIPLYKNKVLKWQQKYKYENSEYVSTNMDSGSIKEVFPKYTFEEYTELSFEGLKSYSFSNYDEQLRTYYGDYMKLPSIEEQNPKHSFDAWIDDGFDYQSVLLNDVIEEDV